MYSLAALVALSVTTTITNSAEVDAATACGAWKSSTYTVTASCPGTSMRFQAVAHCSGWGWKGSSYGYTTRKVNCWPFRVTAWLGYYENGQPMRSY